MPETPPPKLLSLKPEYEPPSLRKGAIVAERYELLERRGAGAMGSVWSAKHLSLGHTVAIKFLHVHTATSEEAATRFEREARLAARLGEESRHIARVTDHGITKEGTPFLVMEFLRGEGLDKLLKREERLSLPLVAQIISQLTRAMHVAHSAGVVHRDLKPANVFICQTEDEGEFTVKLLDFGVAKATLEVDDEAPTREGMLVGTPSYMSPEQIVGGNVDHRSDLWAIAAMVYRMTVGRVAFGSGSLSELGLRIVTMDPAPPAVICGDLPPELNAWMKKGLAKKPEERFQSARELSDSLALVSGVTAGWTGLFSPAAKKEIVRRIAESEPPTMVAETLVAPKPKPPADSLRRSPQIFTDEQLTGAPGATTASWYLQRGRGNPIGPFTTEEVRDGVLAGEIPYDALAREVAESAWRPLKGIVEFEELVASSVSADAAHMDAERLAPVEGPKWSSRADRHVGRGGVGTSPLSSPAPIVRDKPAVAVPQPPKKQASIASLHYEAPSTGHRLVAAALAGLGLTWILMRAALVAKLPEGWTSLVEQHHALRAGAIAEIAVGAIVWPLVLFGAIGSGRRRAFGTPLVRASAWAAIFSLVLVAVVATVMITSDATWSIDPRKVLVLAVACAAPVMLALCAAWLLRLFPEDADGPRMASLAPILVAAAGAFAALLLFTWPDVVYVVPVGTEPPLVFTDAHAARDDSEGRRLGVAGMFERRRAQTAAFVVPAAAPARYLDETRFDLPSGPVVVRAISLIDGSEAGRVVYVSSEALRSRP